MGYSSVLSLIKELILTELSHSSIIIFTMSVVFFAMFVKTVTGFGSAIICAPLFAFFLSPQATVTIIIVNSVMQGVIMVIRLKKYIRFILAVLALPVYLPLWILSAVLTGGYELLSSRPEWSFYIKYHFDGGTKWYRFK